MNQHLSAQQSHGVAAVVEGVLNPHLHNERKIPYRTPPCIKLLQLYPTLCDCMDYRFARPLSMGLQSNTRVSYFLPRESFSESGLNLYFLGLLHGKQALNTPVPPISQDRLPLLKYFFQKLNLKCSPEIRNFLFNFFSKGHII